MITVLFRWPASIEDERRPRRCSLCYDWQPLPTKHVDPCPHTGSTRQQHQQSCIFISFTDGESVSISAPAGVPCSSFKAKVLAISKAGVFLRKKKHRMHLSQIVGQAFKSRFSWVNTSLSTLSTTSTTIRRIPAHVGLPGNETADHPSSEVSQLFHLVNPTIYSESKTPSRTEQARVSTQKLKQKKTLHHGKDGMWSLQEIHNFFLIQTKHEITAF